MSELTKLALNNQIVLMRQDIRRAKVHTINKLSKESKKLKARKGPEDKKEKFIKKGERMIEEIRLIKEVNEDDVSKFVLTNVEIPEAILNDVSLPLKRKIMAKLSMNKFVIASVAEFKKNYPDSERIIVSLLSQLGKNVKKKKQVKENKKIDNENSVQNNSEIINTSGNSFTVSPLSSHKKVDKTVQNVPKKKEKKKKNAEQEKDGIKSNKRKRDESLVEEEVSDNEKKEEIEKKEKENDGIKNNKRKRDKSLVEEEESDNKKKEEIEKKGKQVENNKKKNKELKVVDPFFVTADDKEYITLVSNERQAEALQNNVDSSGFNSNSFWENESSFNENNFNKNFSNKNKVTKFEELRGFSKAKEPRRERRLEINRFEKTQEEKLHPSWEAKKKVSGIAEFAGKKIVFDD